MKKLIFLLLLTIPLSIVAQEVHFFKGSLSEALKEAAKENKLVFVDLHADWCKPCKYMASEVFKHEDISPRMNAFFINVQLNVDYAEGKTLLEKTGAQGIPTVVFLDTTGHIVEQKTGFDGIVPFQDLIQSVYAKSEKGLTFIMFEQAYTIRKYDAAFVNKFFKLRSALGFQNDKFLDNYFAKLPKDSLQTSTTEQILVHNLTSLDGKAFQYVLKNKQKKRFANKLKALVSINFQKAIAEKDEKLLKKVLKANEQIEDTPSVSAEENARFEMDYYFLTKDFARFHKSTTTFINTILLPNLEKAHQNKDTEMENKLATDVEQLSLLYFKNIKKKEYCLELSTILNGLCEKYNRADLLTANAHLLYRMGDIKKAQEAMEKAVNLAPKNEELMAVLNKINKKEL